MGRPQKPGVPWTSIRERYISGETPTAIAKDLCSKKPKLISRHAIEKRAKKESWGRDLTVENIQVPESQRHKDTAERRATIFRGRKAGLSRQSCARLAGIDPKTLYRWLEDDSEFARQFEACTAEWELGHNENIDRHSEQDWRASQWRVQSHPDTRDNYKTAEKTEGTGGITVILNVPRDSEEPVVIEGKVVDLDEVP